MISIGGPRNSSLSCAEITKRAIGQLATFTQQALQAQLEPIRLARSGYALLASGCSVKGTFPGDRLASYLIATQHRDGGWADVEETLWCLGYLAAFGDKWEPQLANGRNWLTSVQLPCGAWGKSERDQPRIPVTALASALVPEVVGASALRWLASQWESDLASSVQLTYKGAFFLVAQAHTEAPLDDDLVDSTLAYLCDQQEEDGGFSPWKGHPVGSDTWSTGVALWGLSRFVARISGDTVEQAVSWFQSNQLPDGLWPYHYLDDGAAMALIGISNVLPFLSE
ncbi:terpene cyclase/mutase family protein [Dehalococcoidales bacterium]|nr:terpene cyclase/mutase family protein [Dehalococcoidales bacterium]MCL0091277.1 terpene cyclase/mutase family protein [Dehalococcoidales bacterium]